MTEGCSYTNPGFKETQEGGIVTYSIKVTNFDEEYPLGVDIKIEIDQPEAKYVAKNSRFHLDFGETDTCYIYVYTSGFEGDHFWTNVSHFEMGPEESTYDGAGRSFLKTTIIRDGDVVEQRQDDDQSSSNIFLGVLSISILSVVAVFIYQYRYLFAFRGYSLLRKDEVLENENRNEIYGLICNVPGGMTASEITRQLGFPHHRLTQYHLRRLRENGYVKMVDKRYYPAGVNADRPFIEQIRGAMLDGAYTPSQIAKKLGTYPNKVKRHMIKNGMWGQ